MIPGEESPGNIVAFPVSQSVREYLGLYRLSGDVGKDQHKEEMAQLYSSSTDRVATLGEKIAQPGLAGSDNTPVVRSVVPHCLWVTSLSFRQ